MRGSARHPAARAVGSVEAAELSDTIARLVGRAVPWLGDWCVAVLVGDSPTRGVAHRDPLRVAAVEAYAEAVADERCLDAPLWTVLTTGVPWHLPSASPTTLDLTCRDPWARRLLSRLEPTSGTAVPLAARGRRLGVLELWNTGSRPSHTAEEIAAAVELGRRAGLAADRARPGALRMPPALPGAGTA